MSTNSTEIGMRTANVEEATTCAESGRLVHRVAHGRCASASGAMQGSWALIGNVLNRMAETVRAISGPHHAYASGRAQ